MRTLDDLIPLITNWAEKKDLLKYESADKQRLKLVEEVGELASAILKNDIALQRDSIGDCFVVLVILSKQIDSKLQVKPMKYHQSINQCIYEIIRVNSYDSKNTYIWELYAICTELELDLVECVNLAWNEIKDRKGVTENGTFLREQN
jgi:NTP pyrophosphatase (non-canonical NTP hydrolase)